MSPYWHSFRTRHLYIPNDPLSSLRWSVPISSLHRLWKKANYSGICLHKILLIWKSFRIMVFECDLDKKNPCKKHMTTTMTEGFYDLYGSSFQTRRIAKGKKQEKSRTVERRTNVSVKYIQWWFSIWTVQGLEKVSEAVSERMRTKLTISRETIFQCQMNIMQVIQQTPVERWTTLPNMWNCFKYTKKYSPMK